MRSTALFCALFLSCFLAPVALAKRAPDLELKDLAGKKEKVSDLRGTITVINFWATWCGPCREELPLLTKLNAEYAPKKVRFIAASADERKNRAAVDRFVETNQVGMDIWVGADLDMIERAGLGNVLPATLILDEQGDVVARVLGEAREDDIRRPLDWLLGGKNGPSPEPVVKHY
ncbi:MAG: TlpA disulfide reductase family protein [Terracidiphilus sp.]